MNKTAFSLALGVSLITSLASAKAYDSDPGYGRPEFDSNTGYSRNTYGNQQTGQRVNTRYQAVYYRPIQRYYGKGYTIAYNYVPVTRQTMRVTTDYEPQNLNIPANRIAAYGVRNPRIAYSNTQAETRLQKSSIARRQPSITPAAPNAPTEPLPVATGPVPK